jgi:tetrahydromethanopterin S-methyltransferase subunit G
MISVNDISCSVSETDHSSLVRNKQFCTIWRNSRKEGWMDGDKLPNEITHLITFKNKNDEDMKIGFGMISVINEKANNEIVVLERLDIHRPYQNDIHIFYSILNNIISNAKLLKNDDDMLNQLFSSTLLLYLNTKTIDTKIITSLKSNYYKCEHFGMNKNTTEHQFKNGAVINLLPKDNFHASFLVINKTTVKKEVPKSISNKKKKLNDDALPNTVYELESLEFDLINNVNAKNDDITKFGERIDNSNEKNMNKFIKTQEEQLNQFLKTQATELDKYKKKQETILNQHKKNFEIEKRKLLKSRQDEINKIEKQLKDIDTKKQILNDEEILRGDTQMIDDYNSEDDFDSSTNNPPNVFKNDDDNTDLHHKTPNKVVDDDMTHKYNTLEKNMNDVNDRMNHIQESIDSNQSVTANMFQQIMSKIGSQTESVTTNINTDTDANINNVKEKEVASSENSNVEKKDKKEEKKEKDTNSSLSNKTVSTNSDDDEKNKPFDALDYLAKKN